MILCPGDRETGDPSKMEVDDAAASLKSDQTGEYFWTEPGSLRQKEISPG